MIKYFLALMICYCTVTHSMQRQKKPWFWGEMNYKPTLLAPGIGGYHTYTGFNYFLWSYYYTATEWLNDGKGNYTSENFGPAVWPNLCNVSLTLMLSITAGMHIYSYMKTK